MKWRAFSKKNNLIASNGCLGFELREVVWPLEAIYPKPQYVPLVDDERNKISGLREELHSSKSDGIAWFELPPSTTVSHCIICNLPVHII